jgi:hypothetical protein
VAAIAITHRNQIIKMMREGAHLSVVAADLGVTPGAISQYLSHDPDYRAAREIGAEIRLERQYEQILSADDQLKLARAREGFRAAAWFAEREFPQRWGQRSELTHQAGQSFTQLLEQVARNRNAALPNAPITIDSQGGDVSDDA